MSEVKKSDRLEILKQIADNEAKSARLIQKRIKDLLASVESLREDVSRKKQEFLDEKARLEMERSIAEKAKEAMLREQQEKAEAEKASVAAKEEAAKPVTEEKPIEAPAAEKEEVKPRPGDIADIRVEDFIGSSKKKAAAPATPAQPKVYTHEDKPSFSSNKKVPLSDKDKKKNGNVMDDRKRTNKKEKIKKGYEQNQSSIEYDEISGEITKIRVRKSGSNDKKKHAPVVAAVIDHAVITSTDITIKQLSEKIGKSVAEIIKKLFFEYQIVKTINDNIDFDTAELISSEFGVTLKLELEKTSEEKLIEFHDESEDDDQNKVSRPPIVTIMGHVDHGKTSILDYIRKSHVASGEAGGITQHIGAYTIQVHGDNGEKKNITFLDTPGHEAFTAMRARGANITDIAVIVVAADDGIMPQTIEAIHHAKAAGVQMIVAINKMDKPTANPDKVLQQLAENDVLVDEWNGDVPAVRVSAKTGQNIDQLLDVILMVAEMQELKANPNRSAHGTIIEARLDKGKGPVATVLVQNGTLHTGDFIVAGMAVGRVRAMFDDKGRPVSSATPSMPVSVLGLQEVPNAGDQMRVVVDEKLSRQVVEERKAKEKIEKLKARKTSLEDVFSRIEEGKLKDLNLILKADVQGSVEAVKASLLRLSNNEVKVHVVHSGVGAINESDVSLADTTNAIIIGFNIRPDTNAKNMAEKSGVDIRLYRVIYDAIDDVEKAIKGMLAPVYVEVHLGRAEVRQLFRISSVGTIAGCMVKEGKITRNAKVRLLRDNVVICETSIASLRRVKDDVKEVVEGYDCGIGLTNYNNIHENDVIEAYMLEEKK